MILVQNNDVFVFCFFQVTVRKVMERDAFIVLASDGVWEFMKNREVSVF